MSFLALIPNLKSATCKFQGKANRSVPCFAYLWAPRGLGKAIQSLYIKLVLQKSNQLHHTTSSTHARALFSNHILGLQQDIYECISTMYIHE